MCDPADTLAHKLLWLRRATDAIRLWRYDIFITLFFFERIDIFMKTDFWVKSRWPFAIFIVLIWVLCL